MSSKCALCNPKEKDWEEQGFYGSRCGMCKANTAFLVASEHRQNIEPHEREIVSQLIEKYYPGFKEKNMSKTNKFHWYAFLVKEGQ